MSAHMDRRRPRRHGATASDKRRCLFDRVHAGEGAGGPYCLRQVFAGEVQ